MIDRFFSNADETCEDTSPTPKEGETSEDAAGLTLGETSDDPSPTTGETLGHAMNLAPRETCNDGTVQTPSWPDAVPSSASCSVTSTHVSAYQSKFNLIMAKYKSMTFNERNSQA